VAGDHGAAEGPSGGLAEEASEDGEEQPADVGEEIPIVPEKDAKDLGDGPYALSVGQGEQQVLVEVLLRAAGFASGRRRDASKW